ncbi:MAG: hypothetical protein WDM79_04305 [Terricaulis sp.]
MWRSAFVAGLGAGAAIGLVNGLVVAKLKINSLIATLAMMQIVRGLAFLTSNGEAVLIPEERLLRAGRLASFSASVSRSGSLCFCFLLFAVVLNATVFGKNVLAIGGNPEAARLAGVPVDRVKIIVFHRAWLGYRACGRRARRAHHQRPAQHVARPGTPGDLSVRAGRVFRSREAWRPSAA